MISNPCLLVCPTGNDSRFIPYKVLTNLKCQVDADCVHIWNSACHPGAGLCACPSGTIYVAQDHACRKYILAVIISCVRKPSISRFLLNVIPDAML